MNHHSNYMYTGAELHNCSRAVFSRTSSARESRSPIPVTSNLALHSPCHGSFERRQCGKMISGSQPSASAILSIFCAQILSIQYSSRARTDRGSASCWLQRF